MDLIKSVIQLFNQRIGCCLQVILITWLLWRPIHCNSNRLNEGNRRTKNFEQRLNQNGFDPLDRPYPRNNRTESTLFSENQNLNNNYLLSVLQKEERQAILNNVIHHKSVPTPASDGDTHKTVIESVPNNDNELEAEDRSDLQDTNKLFSSSLNVIDVSPQDTQLAHSVLIIHKPKPNKTTVKPTFAPQLLFPQTITGTGVKSPLVTAIKNPITTTTESYTPFRNNHRPHFLRPFPGKSRTTTTTPPTTFAVKSTTSSTSSVIYSTNSATDSHTMNTTITTSENSDDLPIIISSNHQKQSFFPMFTRQKLTSTEYALIYTTPESSTESDKSIFTEVPTVQSFTSSPTFTFKPPYVTTLNHQKRPPMKILTVNANRVRQPEEIYSDGITVLDPPFISNHPMKLPPNTTIIHKNLIVPMKDGRPKPAFPMSSTTQFPVYPMVAGITKWHTSPTTSWVLPLVTTTAPEHMITSTVANEVTESESVPVTAQSVNRPTVVTGHSLMSTQNAGPLSHLVTVTPIRTTSQTPVSPSNTFVVTHSPPRPSTSTQGYVNAIWAPPMPMARPVQAVQPQQSTGSWWSPMANIFSVDNSGSMFSFMNIMRTFMFTILVFFLPPLTLVAALLQTAVG